MFLVYVDESGKPYYSDPESFVLCAVIVNERDWQLIDNAIKQLKIGYFPTLSDDLVELHAMKIVDGDGVFKALSRATRETILVDVFSLLGRSPTTIVASLIDKSRLKKQVDLELWGFRLLFERICWVLDKENMARASSGANVEHGIMLIDSVWPSYDEKVRAKMLSFLRQGTMYMSNRYLIEDPLFVSSQYRNLSQLADLVAWVIRRHLRASNGWKDQLAARLFPMVEARLDKDGQGNWRGAGLKTFP